MSFISKNTIEYIMDQTKFKPIDQMVKTIQSQIAELNEIFNISEDDLLILLNHFNFNSDKLTELLTTLDEQQLTQKKQSIGIISHPIKQKSELCLICIENLQTLFIPCGHGICSPCLHSYLDLQFETQFIIKCFTDKCPCVIPHSFIISNYKNINFYNRTLIRTYTKQSKTIKICPNDQCSYFIDNPYRQKQQFLKCICGEAFCLICNNGDHQPCNCHQIDQWIKKINQDNMSYIMKNKNTKFCPKCRQPIEKNQGCNHMTCSSTLGCGYEFCWLCLGNWKEHSSETGGYYRCNKFDETQNKNELNLDKNKSEHEKYLFYSLRYLNHENGFKILKRKKVKLEKKINKLCNLFKLRQEEIDVIKRCYNFLMVARNRLKMTYCFGYYLHKFNPQKLPLFEFNQAEFERGCEQLHEMIEIEFDKLIKSKSLEIQKWMDFRLKMINFQNTTETFMIKFVKEMQGLLPE